MASHLKWDRYLFSLTYLFVNGSLPGSFWSPVAQLVES